MTVTQPDETNRLPYLTADLPGIGGGIKARPEDFLVEEIPLYQPCGEGTHTYLRIEKRGLTTTEAVRRIARALGKQPRDIGYAGLKDAQAITRQTLSVEHVDPERVVLLDVAGVRVLAIDRHTNKLKRGHLAGNRFEIKVRDADGEALPRIREIYDVLCRRGLPNYFGPQRFGRRGDNGRVGLAVMKNDLAEAVAILLGRPVEADPPAERSARAYFDAGRLDRAAAAWPGFNQLQIRMCRNLDRVPGDVRGAWRTIDYQMRELYLSAGQSELFNRVLATRIDGIDRLETGDLAWKHVNGACFLVEDAEVEQPRCRDLEISPTGPLFGRRMSQPTGAPWQRELDVLMSEGLDVNLMPTRDTPFQGGRRPLRVPLNAPDVSEGRDDCGPFIRVAFELPSGSYATAVLRETCKSTDAAAPTID